MKALGKVAVQYDFEAQQPEDLAVVEGDVIEVFDTRDEWYFGMHSNGCQGWFPATYCGPLETAATALEMSDGSGAAGADASVAVSPAAAQNNIDTSKRDIIGVAKCVMGHDATTDGELSLKLGKSVFVIQNDGDVWFGELRARGRDPVRGWFPAHKVSFQEKKKQQTLSKTSPSVVGTVSETNLTEAKPSDDQTAVRGGTSPGRTQYTILYDYNAEQTSELSVSAGDT